MKRNYGLLGGMMMAIVVAAAGCGGGGEGETAAAPAKAAPVKVDTAAFEKSMSSADPAAAGDTSKVVAALKAGDFSGAMAPLNNLAAQAKLTPEQKQAVTDMIEKVKAQVAAAAAKATEEGKKMLEGGKKAVGDLVPATK